MRDMISWRERFSTVHHGIFLFIFLELKFDCVGHPRQKKTLPNSFTDNSPDAMQLRKAVALSQSSAWLQIFWRFFAVI